MSIFASRRDAKKSDDKQDGDAVTAEAAAAEAASAQATVDEKAGIEAGTVQPAIVEPGVVEPATVAAGVIEPAAVTGAETASAAPPAAEPVDFEPVDIEPVDIDPPSADGAPLAFGIADAIRLMRSLPADPNIDLVVRVVRVTLGAVNVSVEEIMEDALRKEKGIQDNIAGLELQVAELEKQLYARRCEIAAHEADLKETASVRERLHMADKYTGPRPPPTPPDATRVLHPKPSEWALEWEKAELAKRGS